MTAIDLTKKLKGFNQGWVAMDKKYKVVAQAKSFKAVSDKVKKRNDIVLMPASDNYFGFVT